MISRRQVTECLTTTAHLRIRNRAIHLVVRFLTDNCCCACLDCCPDESVRIDVKALVSHKKTVRLDDPAVFGYRRGDLSILGGPLDQAGDSIKQALKLHRSNIAPNLA